MPGCRRFTLDGRPCANTVADGFDCGRHTARSLAAAGASPGAAHAAVGAAGADPFLGAAQARPVAVSPLLRRCCPDHQPPAAVTPGDTWLFDVDGTLADVSHAERHLNPDHPDYDKKSGMHRFHLDGLLSPPNDHVADLARQVHDVGGRVVVVTARSGEWATPTAFWLADNNIPFEQVHSRLQGDQRSDGPVKSDIFDQLVADGHHITCAVDDRPQVVETWCGKDVPVHVVDRPSLQTAAGA